MKRISKFICIFLSLIFLFRPLSCPSKDFNATTGNNPPMTDEDIFDETYYDLT